MQGLLKNSFELISRDNEGRKIVIGLSVALCAFVLLAWLGLKQIFHAEIHPNPPAVLNQLAQKARYGTEAELAEILNYYQTVWRIDYEREMKGKQSHIQNWLANSQTAELKKKTEFLGHWMHAPLSEWHKHLKNIQHDYAYQSNYLPIHSQEYWMMFMALHKVYDGANYCQGRLFLRAMDAWQGQYSNEYRKLQSSCGDSSTQALFQFLAQYQASDLRQPSFIENAIMAIENNAIDEVKQQHESQIAWLNYLIHSQS